MYKGSIHYISRQVNNVEEKVEVGNTHSAKDAAIQQKATTHPLKGSVRPSHWYIRPSLNWSNQVPVPILCPPLYAPRNTVQPRLSSPFSPWTVGHPAISRQSITMPTAKLLLANSTKLHEKHITDRRWLHLLHIPKYLARQKTTTRVEWVEKVWGSVMLGR